MIIERLAWCYKNDHDKVWGFIANDDTFYSFWGRRGRKLTFKEHQGSWYKSSLEQKFNQKLRGGYKEVTINNIEDLTPGFTDELETNLSLARLCDSFHGGINFGKY